MEMGYLFVMIIHYRVTIVNGWMLSQGKLPHGPGAFRYVVTKCLLQSVHQYRTSGVGIRSGGNLICRASKQLNFVVGAARGPDEGAKRRPPTRSSRRKSP